MKKKWKTKVGNKIVKHGAKGYWIGRKGSPKQKAYCARSLGIAKKFPNARKIDSPNYQSRRKWKCPINKLEKSKLLILFLLPILIGMNLGGIL